MKDKLIQDLTEQYFELQHDYAKLKTENEQLRAQIALSLQFDINNLDRMK